MGCHLFLQGIFLTQGLNPCLLHCRQILYHWATREAKKRLNRPPFGCRPAPVMVQTTDGEGASSQVRAEQAAPSLYKKLWFTCHIKGDLRLHWGNENGSSGICIQAGTEAHQSVWAFIQLIHKELQLVGVALWVSPRSVLRTFPLPVSPFLTEAHWFGPRQLLGGLSSFPSPSRSPWGGGWIRTAKSCIFFISLWFLLASFIILVVTDPEGLLYQGWWGVGP